MADEIIIQDGIVTEILPSEIYQVKLDNGQIVSARISSKLTRERKIVRVGDKVKVEMSPYDLTKGRITERY